VSLVLFPILMARQPNPLVPLELFRSRAFATVNLATFFIYGALYVTFFYQAVILQGVLGYTALGAGIVGIPSGIMLALLSTRIGTLAGRLGSRRFLVAGPLLMALALLWYARLPLDSAPWRAALDDPSTLVLPIDVFIDILPFTLLFGLGISCVVAPLTSTRMGSISAVSRASARHQQLISRVGQPPWGAHLTSSARPTTHRSARPPGSTRATRTCATPSSRSIRRPPGPALPRPPPRTRRRSTPSTWRC
jgi:hypothetical protein